MNSGGPKKKPSLLRSPFAVQTLRANRANRLHADHTGPDIVTTLDILERLIAFPTVSRDPNIALINYCADLLDTAGADVRIIPNDDGGKANLYATIGPTDTWHS